MDEAQKWRARAARYREYADLALDDTARSRRMARARNFERLAAELEGINVPQPALPRPLGPGIFRALARVVGFGTAGG